VAERIVAARAAGLKREEIRATGVSPRRPRSGRRGIARAVRRRYDDALRVAPSTRLAVVYATGAGFSARPPRGERDIAGNGVASRGEGTGVAR